MFKRLRTFAEEKINAAGYSDAVYVFTPKTCLTCEAAAFRLTVEHHTSSQAGNFRGKITGRCGGCGAEQSILTFTGSHRRPTHQEKPVCPCGHSEFITAELERHEREDFGLFFDEGILVGACTGCGRQQVIVFTD